MNPHNHLSFEPHHNVSALIQNDRTALAHQLLLCHTDRSGWHRVGAVIKTAQAFASRHLVSMLVLVLAVCGTVGWLVG
jgi:hypothetical protein